MIKRILAMSVVAGAALMLSSSNANAQWGCTQPSNYGYGSGYGGGYGGGYRAYSNPASVGGLRLSIGGYGNSLSYRSGGYSARSYGYQSLRPTWHDTTHLDYHAPSIVPHGSHYHVTPGHYDVHRSGHWDTHGRHH